jgi:hypothetical protein
MLCIDTDPALGDRCGEVVCFVHDSQIERGIASGYLSWLETLAMKLERGGFRVDDAGYLWLDIDG